MNPLVTLFVGWVFGLGFGAFLGYFIPKLYARSVAKAVERERVVAALAGEQPSWERVAAELEQAALEHARKGHTADSQILLDQAGQVRARGRHG